MGKIYWTIVYYQLYWKDENKEKRGREWPIFKKNKRSPFWQWLWLSWQSGCFQYQRSKVWIQSSAKIYLYGTFVNCQLCFGKMKIKKKRPEIDHFFQKDPFSRKRWTTGSAQYWWKDDMCSLHYFSICHKHNSLPLGVIQPSYPSSSMKMANRYPFPTVNQFSRSL